MESGKPTRSTPRSFGIISGSSWVMASRVSAQISQLALIVIAARFLTPDEFGLFALVSIISVTAMRIAEAGCSDFVASWQGGDEAVEAAFVAALAIGLTLGLVGFGIAGGFPSLSPTISALVFVFSLWLPLAIITPVQSALLVRQGRLGTLSRIQIAAEVLALVAAVGGLLLGMGVFALAIARLVSQVTSSACVAATTRFFPKRLPTLSTLKPALLYCRSIGAVRAISCIRGSIFPLVIGGFLGPAAIGLYRAAERLIGAVSEVLSEPATMVGWVLVRRATAVAKLDGRDPKTAIRDLASTFLPILIAIAAPIFLLVAMFASEGIAFLLGEEWRGAGPIITILALARFLAVPSSLTAIALSFTDQVKRMPPISVLNCVVAITISLIMVQFGVLAVAVGEVIAAVILVSTTIYLQGRAGVDWRAIVADCWPLGVALAACAAGAFAALSTGLLDALPEIVGAIFAALCGLAAYGAVLILLRPRALAQAAALRHNATQAARTV